MIVQAINIGFDVQDRQFDLLIPGGDIGAFTGACAAQWGTSDLGAQYGGRLRREPVRPAQTGCLWFVDWFQVANNPNLVYAEVECPQAIIDVSGVDRRPLDDIAACD
jgi:hypothetical protein